MSRISVPHRLYKKIFPQQDNVTNKGELGFQTDNGEILEYSKKDIQTIDLDLTNAATNREYLIVGNMLAVNFVSDPTALVTVKYDRNTANAVKISQGWKLGGFPFTKVYLSWAAQSGITMQIIYLMDFPQDEVLYNGG